MDQSTPEFTSSTEDINNLSELFNNISVINTAGQDKNREIVKAKIFSATILSTVLIFGTIGNLLTFIVMQRGSLKHSSTCFYMSILALSDSCKYSSHTLLQILLHIN